MKQEIYLKLSNLEKEKDILNQLVGELRATKNTLTRDLTKAQNEKSDADKVKIITQYHSRDRYDDYTQSNTSVTYQNLDDVITGIRKEENKKANLEVEQVADLEVNILRLEKQLKRTKEGSHEQINEARKNLTKLHQADRESYEDEIEKLQKAKQSLIQEIKKVKDSKTDKEVNAQRKQEIIDLKVRIAELETEIKNLGSINFVKRVWNKFTNRSAIVAAINEKEDKEMKVNEISNKYHAPCKPCEDEVVKEKVGTSASKFFLNFTDPFNSNSNNTKDIW